MSSRGWISTFLFVSMTAGAAHAQSLDNKGRDFIIAFLPNFSGATLELHLTADEATDVTVEYPYNSPSFTTTVPVLPGEVTIVGIPIGAEDWTPGAVMNNSVHAFADEEFVCYQINRRQFTSDAALALPVDTMNTEYIVVTTTSNIVVDDRSQFVVTAAFNNTVVTITPSANLASGLRGDETFEVTLQRGEGFFGQAAGFGPANDLTGTTIEASRPVGMTNGNVCTNVPPSTAFCDHVFEVAQPVQSWGTSALVANLPNRPGGSVYRILSASNNNEIRRNGEVIGTIHRGGFLQIGPLAGDHMITGSAPMFVAQFMTGSSSPGATLGDPAMGNMIPSAQYLSKYTFSTIGGAQFRDNFVTLIARDADVAAVELDGAPIGQAGFSPIAGSGFSVARVPIASGTHQTESPNPHGITVEGYNTDDSYLYPGGALFQFINPTGDANPPICEVDTVDAGAKLLTATARDDRPSEDTNGNNLLDEGEDLNGNGEIDEDTGIFFVELLEGAQNVSLNVDAFEPGDPIVGFTATAVNPSEPVSGKIRATDGAGNTCEIEVDFSAPPLPEDGPQSPPDVVCQEGGTTTIQLDSGIPAEEAGQFTFLWQSDCPGSSLSNPASSTPVLSVSTASGEGVECNVSVTISNGVESVSFTIPIRIRCEPIPREEKFAPSALDQVEVISCNVPYTFSFDCRDLNADDVLTARVMKMTGNGADAPFEGQLDVDGLTGTYSPVPGTNGVYFVEYECSDGESDSGIGRVALWVLTCEDGSPTGNPIPIGSNGCPGNLSLATIAMTCMGIGLLGGVRRRTRRAR